MPSVVRAMPQIKKLAIKIGDDEEAVAALESLVKQLVEQDLQKLREKANKP
jgi:dephospho-CoA kinase